MYKIVLTGQAVKDSKKADKTGLKKKILELIEIIENDPFAFPPTYEYPGGEFSGLISRRINKQHRLV